MKKRRSSSTSCLRLGAPFLGGHTWLAPLYVDIGLMACNKEEALAVLAPQLRREDAGDYRSRVAYAFGRAGKNAAASLPPGPTTCCLSTSA
jgi:hypothetical protein